MLAVAFFVFAVVGLVVLRLAKLGPHVEVFQDVACDAGEGHLILGNVLQPCEILAGFFFNPRTPEIDQRLRGGWWLEACQLFAHDHRDGFCERSFVLGFDTVVAA